MSADRMCPKTCPRCHMQPGSGVARVLYGCTCPVIDNARGHADVFVLTSDCPVHDQQQEKR